MKRTVTIMNDDVFKWENQAKQYPINGSGIVYFKGVYDINEWVDCLLYYKPGIDLTQIPGLFALTNFLSRYKRCFFIRIN
jgi:hypothetical protein